VEVCNSFEMNYKEVEGAIKIDMDYFEIKLEQCTLSVLAFVCLSRIRVYVSSFACRSLLLFTDKVKPIRAPHIADKDF
jgi:hypothetical protein